MSDQKTERLIIKWIMRDKKCVKFKEKTGNFTLSDKVAGYELEKYGVNDGATVDVAIENNVVTYIKAATEAKKEAVKEEPKQEKAPEAPKEQPAPTPAQSSDVKTWTVAGFTQTKEVIKFKESENPAWYQVPQAIRDLDWEKLGIKAKATVQVKLGTVEVKGEQKPAILDIQVVKSEPESQPEAKNDSQEKPQGKKSWSSEKDESIERQCAWKSACHAVGTGCQGQVSLNDYALLEEKIKKLAIEGLNFIKGQQ